MTLRYGKAEGIPYSLSRWTDVPDAKWPWFREVMRRGVMEAFDPTTGVPCRWSLAPCDTLALVFWTKNPANLINDQTVVEFHPVKVHVTATGWHEVERGAPGIDESIRLLTETVRVYGAANVTWRFSPVPILPFDDLLGRFFRLAEGAARAGLKSVYISFLQPNDRVPETRTALERLHLLSMMAQTVGAKFGLDLLLCNEDRALERWGELVDLSGDPVTVPANLKSGVCVDPSVFAAPTAFGDVAPRIEACGCVLMADPFTINESCTLGCLYCYASDKSLTGKKRNTTRRLPVVQ
jgi:hypothetical protein